MKAAILTDINKLEIRETPVPDCPAGGVLVNVRACGICSADAKMVTEGHRSLVYPRILGHEIAGIVAESRIEIFKPGDRVQVSPGLRCEKCRPCLKGSDNLCENRDIYGFTRDGGFSQFVPVPLKGPLKGALHLLPENINFTDATLAEPLACCINAQDNANIRAGDVVMIIGAGPLGLLHSFAARQKGAEKIILSEILPHRRDIGTRLFADSVIDPTNPDLPERVMDATHDKGVDAIIFACSQTGLNDTFMKLLAPGGRISFFSGTSPLLAESRLDSNFIHYNEISISGAYGCTADQNKQAIHLLASGQLPFDELITNRVVLEDIKKGFEHTKYRKGIKSVVEVQNG